MKTNQTPQIALRPKDGMDPENSKRKSGIIETMEVTLHKCKTSNHIRYWIMPDRMPDRMTDVYGIVYFEPEKRIKISEKLRRRIKKQVEERRNRTW